MPTCGIWEAFGRSLPRAGDRCLEPGRPPPPGLPSSPVLGRATTPGPLPRHLNARPAATGMTTRGRQSSARRAPPAEHGGGCGSWTPNSPSSGVTIVKPIVYGNVARYFGKKREEDGHTHQWTVYVKPYRNEDMSAYVKKIQFKLHESYGNPLRVVTKPPYEITETGWGEFEIIIKIFFIDPNERPVTLYHLLKLFQSDTNAMLGKKTVVSEFYDEMIFQDPTAMMQQLLTTSRQLTLGAYKHETEFAELEVKTREKLEAAKKKTSFEIAELKERLKASRETINCLKNEIRKLGEDDQTKEI
ncbi:YEATS domain-containing protein 4 isoform X1 [Ornithorhynchus anatinus]|uniref:YEATS domain-containing protein 4 isoform X1 n=1 Tax=Ornithorhynchus anatinus TaxID=9258 RepID=UPI0010A91541|nr:YEATS domain-containing protein 4 isoform X1 [Ornithorhynchus anatinus]